MFATSLQEPQVTSSESLARGMSIARTVALAGLWVALAATLAASQPVSSSELTAAPPIVAAAMPSSPAMSAPDSVWQKRWWIEKTARLLRGGDGLGPNDDLDALLKLPEETIARAFMNDPRFGDTILDFNMFYLGFKVDALKADRRYTRNAFDFPNAVAAAQALLLGGDYFKLFDLEGPFYMAPLPLTFDDPLPPEEAALSPEALRMKVMDEAQASFFGLIEMASKPVSPTALCDAVRKITETPTLHNRLVRAFNDPEIFFLIRGRVLT